MADIEENKKEPEEAPQDENPENDDSRDDDAESNDEEIIQRVSKPIVPQEWKSENTEEIVGEIKQTHITPTRPLKKVFFVRKRREFGGPYKLNDKDANEPPFEIRQMPDTSTTRPVVKKTLDMGLQGSLQQVDNATQTQWFKKRNNITQTIHEDLEVDIPDDDPTLIKLIKNYEIMFELEQALQQNEMMDVYQDDFAVLPFEELNEADASKLTYDLTELKSVTYQTTVGKRATNIRVMPKIADNLPRYVCVSYKDQFTFDEKMDLFRRSMVYSMLLWDIEDVNTLQPAMEIQSPLEINTFEFHPKNPAMIIGGASNGQIVRWDLEKAIRDSGLLNKKAKTTKQESDKISAVKPYRFSALQSFMDPNATAPYTPGEVKKMVSSHRAAIIAIKWIPNKYEVEKRGLHHTVPNKTPGEYYQFVSLGEDGQILIWDLRFPPEKEVGQGEYIWKAMFGVQAFKPEGPIGGAGFVFTRHPEIPEMLCASDDGDVYTFDWTQRATEDTPKIEFVTKIWNAERSYRPIVGIELSPFFDDIILSFHDYYFCLWRMDTDVPIFYSPILEHASISCGCFSPVRPGVIFVGRTDGHLDIWDLTDQSHTYIMHHFVISAGIASMKFQANSHLLNIGDNEGALRVYSLPQNLTKKVGDEEASMRFFFDREVRRVDYFRNRFEIRKDDASKKREERDDDEDEKKDDQKNDEIEFAKLEEAYQAFVTEWVDENIHGKKPEEKEKKKR